MGRKRASAGSLNGARRSGLPLRLRRTGPGCDWLAQIPASGSLFAKASDTASRSLARLLLKKSLGRDLNRARRSGLPLRLRRTGPGCDWLAQIPASGSARSREWRGDGTPRSNVREKSLGRDLNPGSRPYQGRALPLSYRGTSSDCRDSSLGVSIPRQGCHRDSLLFN